MQCHGIVSSFLQVTKKGKNKDASKPVKQKRRSSVSKGEKTPSGPTPKRTKKVKALQGDNNMNDKENIDIDGVLNASPEMNKFTKMVQGGKPRVAICKDLTSRGRFCKLMEQRFDFFKKEVSDIWTDTTRNKCPLNVTI